MQTYVMASLWSKARYKLQDFLPPWLKDQLRAARTDDAVVSAFEQMLKMAEEGTDADDLNANGRRSVPN